jgi:tetratricopeptide (TPR) repeat protein
VRLTVQLIDARNDHHLLAANYDRDLGHIIGLQSEVARKVADALAATLTHYEQGELDRVATNNGDAYNLYLRAVSLWHQGPHSDGGVKPSIPLLGQALRLEPDYVDALALLSQAYTWSYFDLEHPEDGAHAKEAYERALQLDPDLPEARLARGLYQLYIAHDLDQALSDLTAVLKVRPNSAEAQSVIGLALRRLGRFDDAIPHLQRAWELDPLNSQFAGAPLDTYVALRRYPEALEQAALMQLRFPDWPGGYVIHGGIESFMQHSNEPLRRLLREHADVLSADDRANIEANIARAEGRYLDAVKLLTGAHFDYPIDGDLTIGMLYWAADRKPEAEARFHSVARDAKLELQRVPNDVFYVMPRLALAQSMLGEHAAALATIDAERTRAPESRDRIYGPAISFTRSVILVRAGRAAEGYAEVTRLLHVPFSVPDESDPIWLVVKDDPHYGELINRPPRL